jgi:hypothetical protein
MTERFVRWQRIIQAVAADFERLGEAPLTTKEQWALLDLAEEQGSAS